MTDPGFPQGGGVNPPRGGREHAILPNSPKNCMKLKEFGRRGGGVRPSRPPLDPPLETITQTIHSFEVFTNCLLGKNANLPFRCAIRN